MKLTLLSDLHTEFWSEFPGKQHIPQTDILVLAGDIAVGPTKLIEVLDYFSYFYKEVIYVPGNHEYYNYHIHDIDYLSEPRMLRNNVHFLNPGHIELDGVLFIGATLWTNFRKDPLVEHMAKSMISDFKLIRKFSPASAIRLFEQHIDYIRAIYAARKENQKVVVVTHFLPAVECTHPRFQGLNLLNQLLQQ